MRIPLSEWDFAQPPRKEDMRFSLARKLAITVLLLVSAPLLAANTPCSGRKGGISHCDGATFVCNDGSISASKKICSANAPPPKLPIAGSDGCTCRSGNYCTGPRGGQYCLSDSGAKSYRRR